MGTWNFEIRLSPCTDKLSQREKKTLPLLSREVGENPIFTKNWAFCKIYRPFDLMTRNHASLSLWKKNHSEELIIPLLFMTFSCRCDVWTYRSQETLLRYLGTIRVFHWIGFYMSVRRLVSMYYNFFADSRGRKNMNICLFCAHVIDYCVVNKYITHL